MYMCIYVYKMYMHVYADVHITRIKINIYSVMYIRMCTRCPQIALGNSGEVSVRKLNDGSSLPRTFAHF